MMAPKKAAKKVAKKAAKKVAAKKAHGKGRDTLRAYEHLGRVMEVATRLEEERLGGVQLLLAHAENRLRDEEAADAAEILRAAEHLCFGYLEISNPGDESVSDDLLESVLERYEHFRDRASEREEDQDAPRKVVAVQKSAAKLAKSALKEKRYRAALELIRAVDALTHVEAFGDLKKGLPGGSSSLQNT